LPTDAEQAEAIAKVREVYADRLGATDAQQLRVLVDELIGQAALLDDYALSSRYAMLTAALELAERLGDLSLCGTVIKVTAGQFAVDGLELRRESILRVSAKRSAEPEAVVQALLELGVQAVEAESMDTASTALGAAMSAISKVKDKQQATDLRAKAVDVRDRIDQSRALIGARAKLKEDPTDARANHLVGLSLVSQRGDWEAALPLLSKSADKDLKALAEADLAAVATRGTATSQAALADRWWKLASDKRFAAYKAAFIDRAAYWYGQAMPGLKGLDVKLAETRIKMAGETEFKLALRDRSTDNPERIQLADKPETVDLLKLVKMDRDVVQGEWEQGAKGLESKGESFQYALRFAYLPPEEFDYSVEFTVNNFNGPRDVALIYPIPGGVSGFIVGCLHNTKVSASSVNDNEQFVHLMESDKIVTLGQRNVATVKVRRDSITYVLNDREIKTLKLNGPQKYPNGLFFNPGGTGGLGLSTFNNITIHRAAIRGVSQNGRSIVRLEDYLEKTQRREPGTIVVPLRFDTLKSWTNKLFVNYLPPEAHVLLRGATCKRFVFQQAASSAIFDIPENAAYFRAVGVCARGLNREQNPSLSWRYLVYVDGDEAYVSEPLSQVQGGELKLNVPIPPGAKRIELRVDPMGSNVADWCVWAEPEFMIAEDEEPTGQRSEAPAAGLPKPDSPDSTQFAKSFEPFVGVWNIGNPAYGGVRSSRKVVITEEGKLYVLHHEVHGVRADEGMTYSCEIMQGKLIVKMPQWNQAGLRTDYSSGRIYCIYPASSGAIIVHHDSIARYEAGERPMYAYAVSQTERSDITDEIKRLIKAKDDKKGQEPSENKVPKAQEPVNYEPEQDNKQPSGPSIFDIPVDID